VQNVAEKPEPSEATDPRTKSVSDTARDLATLHHICVSHLKELQVLSKTQVCLIFSYEDVECLCLKMLYLLTADN